MNQSRPVWQLLRSCQDLKTLKSIHANLLVDASLSSSDYALNKFLRLCSRFGALDYARLVFDQIPHPNAFLWTALIHGRVENRRYSEALSLFRRMRAAEPEPVAPINFTLSSVLKALARETRLKDGQAVHAFLFKFGFDFDPVVQNGLLELFMRCGNVADARSVFDEMRVRDVVSWNSMISGYGNAGRVDLARRAFDEMPERTVVSWTSLICGYVKAGDMVEARSLFEAMPGKDLASWNAMISACMDAGDLVTARLIFEAMPLREVTTCNRMISGFCNAGESGAAVDIFRKMPTRDAFSWTAMLDGYIKAGDFDSAKCLFNEMPERNLVSWSLMIGGFAKNGQPLCALNMFERFKESGIKPDDTFVLQVISVCSQLGILETAEALVRDYVGPQLFSNIRVVTNLIDMYAKCGSIEKALQVFEMAHPKDLLCYSTMIAAFANHGLSHDAISLFDEMQRAHIKPDAVSFLGVLSACNHRGLVDLGLRYFNQLTSDIGVQPSEKHYACVVDLLGRAGCLEEAHKLIISMPMSPSSVVWGALIAACRVHHNVPMAEAAAAELFKIEPENSGNYILLSNTYAASGMWSDVSKVRVSIREHRVKKNKGSSWVGLDHIVHEFVMGDVSHPNSDDIYQILDLLWEDMKLLGYLVESKQKELISISSSSHSYL